MFDTAREWLKIVVPPPRERMFAKLWSKIHKELSIGDRFVVKVHPASKYLLRAKSLE